MSTLDSILHANMTVLTRDIYQRYVHKNADQAHYVLVGRLIVGALLVIGYFLSIYQAKFLVILVALSGAGALQLAPALIGTLFPSKFVYTAKGIMSGLLASMATLSYTLIIHPHPLSVHGGVWGVGVNFLVVILVSRFTAPPSRQTVERVHGALEEFVHGGETSKERERNVE